MDSLKKLGSGIYLEGMTIDHDRNIIWFSDAVGGGIHGVTIDGEPKPSFNEDRVWTGAVLLNEDGAVLSSGRGGIMWNNPETGDSGWLLHEIDGQVINGINEMMPDGEGGLFFGTCDIDNVELGQATEPTSLYRLTKNKDVIFLADKIGFSNGIMYDSARNALYCCDTFNGIWAFDVNPDKTLSNRRMLLKKEDADGMVLDAEGNLLITGFRSGFLTRLSPSGELLPQIDLPGDACTQVRFGGSDGRDIYVQMVPGDGGDSLKDGVELTEKRSFLYRGHSEIPGMLLQPTSFKLD